MGNKEGYACPHCGHRERIGYIEPAYNQGVQWGMVEGIWKKVQPTLGTIDGFYYCPACGRQLPNSAVQEWLKEARED